jgi:hypothetical protein
MDLIDKGEDSLSTDEIVPNKRGRKKKVQNSSFDKLPPSATKNLSPELVDELQHGYEYALFSRLYHLSLFLIHNSVTCNICFSEFYKQYLEWPR